MVLSVILKGKAENMEKREWRYSGTIEERTSIREQVHDVLARKVAEEAMVLLKNESLLPLPLDVPMALFGSGAKKTVKGGIGSGMSTTGRQFLSTDCWKRAQCHK